MILHASALLNCSRDCRFFMGPVQLPKPAVGNENSTNSRKKWAILMPIFIALVVIAEIALLGGLDMTKNAAMVDFWADSLLQKSPPADEEESVFRVKEDSDCEKWLEREDTVVYSRDFDKDSVLIAPREKHQKEWFACSVRCQFGHQRSREPDASFDWTVENGIPSVLLSMESSQYYDELNLTYARGKGFGVIMTTSLSSDVPVGYFSWAEYDIMAPVEPKTENALAAAFISNCDPRNFRLEALKALVKNGIPIDSYGACHRNRDGRVNKVETLKRYKFSLAFENSNEEDYVTEKFFHSLVAGSIPVFIGAPNIQDFAPSPRSLLHIRELKEVDTVAQAMKHLAENPDAYDQYLRWKYEGPSDSFKALVDMAAVHSSCRLCIHLATKIREKEENTPGFKKRPCKCVQGSKTVYHVYVRERGRFEMESIFLRSSNLTAEALESAVLKKFSDMRHIPIWKHERPESIRGGDELKIYQIYPLGLTQRQALYSFKFKGESDFRIHIERNPCSKFEVIFV